MEIKTEDGISKPLPMSDIQRNNKLVGRLILLGWIGFAYLIVMTLYIIYNNVVGNIISRCVC